MVAHLSEEWAELQLKLGADLPHRPGASARLQVIVTGAPAGDVAYALAFEDGRLVECALGADPTAEVTLTETHDDAVAIARGEVELSVGYMRGRVKVVGDVGALLRVMGVLQSAEHRELLAALAEQTDL
jgi:alkyl sulfatase BDS1-like metallo-beta-lactamase superfamily hydrolase